MAVWKLLKGISYTHKKLSLKKGFRKTFLKNRVWNWSLITWFREKKIVVGYCSRIVMDMCPYAIILNKPWHEGFLLKFRYNKNGSSSL